MGGSWRLNGWLLASEWVAQSAEVGGGTGNSGVGFVESQRHGALMALLTG